ncbi:MAG: hypothetical protein O7G85_17805 [Planctomycetota bacterium]|nr:hypothetical protein [Planctomycetota bacterium]
MPSAIKGSVGKKGKNNPADVKTIQDLLNGHTKNGGFRKLQSDGLVGKKTIGAIEAFQKNSMGFKKADGRVDPGKMTFKGLSKNSGKLEKEPPADKDGQKAGKGKESGGDSGGGGGKGKVTGDKSGVDKKIIDFVQEVANFYSITININSGKRTPTKQGEVMYKYWVSNLKRGKLYSKIKSDTKLQKKLDDLYEKGKGGDSAAKKEFIAAIAKDAKSYSRHVRGWAIDIPKNTPAKIRNALKTGLRELPEKLCFHYDNKKIKTPKVTDKLRAKWKK